MQKQDAEVFRALKLRPATSEDEPFLMGLFASTRSDELALLGADKIQKEAFIAMQFKAQSRQYNMSYPDADHSILMWNDAPIGRLLLDKGDSEFTLVDVALLPTHRGSGIGTYLIRGLLLEAAETGKPIKLSVWHSNSAKKLYERMGFATTNEDGLYCEMRWNPPL